MKFRAYSCGVLRMTDQEVGADVAVEGRHARVQEGVYGTEQSGYGKRSGLRCRRSHQARNAQHCALCLAQIPAYCQTLPKQGQRFTQSSLRPGCISGSKTVSHKLTVPVV